MSVRKTAPLLAVLPLFLLPFGLEGQGARSERMDRGRAPIFSPIPGLVDRTLEQREAIGLTPDQVERLEAVKQEWETASASAREVLERRSQELRSRRESPRDSLRAPAPGGQGRRWAIEGNPRRQGPLSELSMPAERWEARIEVQQALRDLQDLRIRQVGAVRALLTPEQIDALQRDLPPMRRRGGGRGSAAPALDSVDNPREQ